MNEGLISIIIPVYNAQIYLEKCLQSVFTQTYKSFEVICINDGSTDDSLSILQSYYDRYPQKMRIESLPNGGQANARNIGMELAQGEFICFVDSDDSLKENMLEKMVAQLQLCDCDFVFCNMERIIEGKANYIERKFKFDTNLKILGTTTIFQQPEIICYITVAPFAKILKRSFLIEHNISFIKGYIYEDLVFTQSILAANPKISMVDEKLYDYLVRDNSTMTSKKSKVMDMFIAYKNLYHEYEKNGLNVKFKKELDYLALYHIMVGTSYRMWRSKQYSLFNSIKECRSYLKKYQCDKKNPYLKEKGIAYYFAFIFAPKREGF